jgi:uncharacterized protein (TIGR02996 family)
MVLVDVVVFFFRPEVLTMAANDNTLDTLRTQILESPEDDAPRLAYAARLEEVGRSAEAEWIRGQLACPDDAVKLSGAEAGVPLVEIAVFRRGFVESIMIARARIPALGEVLRAHPVTMVSVWRGCDLIGIKYGVPPLNVDEPNPVRTWYAYTGTRLPPRGGIEQTMVHEQRVWGSRAELVEGIGDWADANLPGSAHSKFVPADPGRPQAPRPQKRRRGRAG